MANNIYTNISKGLVYFNLLSFFFLILVVMLDTIIQTITPILINITNLLFSDPSAVSNLMNILNLFIQIPSYLDFFLIILVAGFIFNIIYLAWKTETQPIWLSLSYSLIGMPIFVYLLGFINTGKLWAINYLLSSVTGTITTPFYNYLVNNSISLSVGIFSIAILINTIDWGNVKTLDKIGKNIGGNGSSSDQAQTLNELLKQ